MFVWSNWLAFRSDFKPDGSSMTPSCISVRTLTSVLTEHRSIRNIGSRWTLTPGASVLPSFCHKHSRKSLFHANRLFPHAFGIMFVTNWLLWKSLMMQADRPAPSSSGGGTLAPYFTPPPTFDSSVVITRCSAAWAVPVWTGDSSDPTWPVGQRVQHHYPPAMPHLIIQPRPERVRAEGSLPAAASQTSLPVSLWRVKRGSAVTLGIFGLPRMIMSDGLIGSP